MAVFNPGDLEQFIKKYNITKSNGSTGVTHIRKDDIILLEGRPCKVTKKRISNVQTQGRLKGIAEVEGLSLLDQSHHRQSFMLFAESEAGVGAFFWNPRIYSCLLIELLLGRIAQLRDAEDPGMTFNIDISDDELIKELKEGFCDGRKQTIRIWYLMGVYRIVGLEDSEGVLLQS